jgi:hypothetical protein
MELIKYLGVFAMCTAALGIAGCGDSDPAGSSPRVSLTCSENSNKDVTVINATNNCDKSTRTAEPFVVEVPVVEAPAE